MRPDGDAALAMIRDVRRPAQPILWLFDYDGTLTPVVARPSLATLSPGVRMALRRLAGLPSHAVGVISGRRLAELRQMVGLAELYYAGTGGMELDLRGRIVRHPDEVRIGALMERIAASLEPLGVEWEGAWLERKPLGLTVHWRDLAPERRDPFRRAIADRLGRWRDKIRTFGGPMATEVLARNGWDKGTAVAQIAAEVSADRPLVIYAGDQDNDRHAFDAVAARRGVTIGIGPNAPDGATVSLADPATLHQLIAAAAE